MVILNLTHILKTYAWASDRNLVQLYEFEIIFDAVWKEVGFQFNL